MNASDEFTICRSISSQTAEIMHATSRFSTLLERVFTYIEENKVPTPSLEEARSRPDDPCVAAGSALLLVCETLKLAEDARAAHEAELGPSLADVALYGKNVRALREAVEPVRLATIDATAALQQLIDLKKFYLPDDFSHSADTILVHLRANHPGAEARRRPNWYSGPGGIALLLK